MTINELSTFRTLCLLNIDHGFVSECDEITKDVFSKHRAGIHDAVGQVKKKLVQLNLSFQKMN